MRLTNYSLYNLTPEEIAIVAGTTQKSPLWRNRRPKILKIR